MNITYVKLRYGKVSTKDPILYHLRDILPDDKVSCAEVPDHMALFGGRKIEFAMHSCRPDLFIGCGDTAEVILKNAHRFCILINPSISQEDEESLRDNARVRIIRTESPSDEIDKEFLENNLLPIVESLRSAAGSITDHLDNLVEMALSPTEQSPEDFDPQCDILENLKKYKDTVELSDRSCPNCGHAMISFFVSSPDWTWADLCGRAGRLTYCPNCKTQHGFWCQIMN